MEITIHPGEPNTYNIINIAWFDRNGKIVRTKVNIDILLSDDKRALSFKVNDYTVAVLDDDKHKPKRRNDANT